MQATRFHSRSGLQKRLFWCSAQSSKSASSSASGLASKKRLSELVADSGGQDGTAKLNASGRPLAFLGATFGSGAAVHHRSAALVLEDGSRFTGMSFGYESFAEGELVFNTGMVGYPENLTDPSYKGQFLVSTYPIVGNYGVPDEAALDSIGLPEFMESDQVHVSAFIVQDYSHHHSHYASRKSLQEWLVSFALFRGMVLRKFTVSTDQFLFPLSFCLFSPPPSSSLSSTTTHSICSPPVESMARGCKKTTPCNAAPAAARAISR